MKSLKKEHEELKAYAIRLQQKLSRTTQETAKLKSVITELSKSTNTEGGCVDKLIRDICELWEVGIGELMLPVRTRRIVEARQVAMFAIRHETDLSFAEIGAKFGGINHSTVIYAIKKVNELATVDSSYKNKLITLNIEKWLTTK